jgi:hypothetical protein
MDGAFNASKVGNHEYKLQIHCIDKALFDISILDVGASLL